MKRYTQWASREYTFRQRLLGLIPAGILFVFLIPFTLIRVVPRLDELFRLPPLFFGWGNIILGGILILAGAVFAFWSIITQMVQARGTPLPMMATQTLLVSGPFKLCRNPMTFGTIMLYLGIGVLVGSISSIAVVAVFAASLLTYIKRVEERELAARFGQAYLAYKATTPFILPKILR